ncbi:MAG: methylated-DNA--[protein]-cysteine S-methyltransferase [Termitinemataceae bacterium]|nr:MAG: methylated-DNA--[protein]-cysteine S-methyltransferase [Termitinemataceae bacterium]
MNVHAVCETPFFSLRISASKDSLLGVSFTQEGIGTGENAITRAAFAQINEYLAGKRRCFELPFELSGTDFELNIWRALPEIPYGATLSYGEIAAKAGSKNAARAAGAALHKNPLAIILPCHRVIGANGALTGFAGGIDIKRRLLELERHFLKADSSSASARKGK